MANTRKAPAASPPKRVQDYPRPLVAVDLVIFTIVDADLKLLLIERGEAPFLGQPALPGGFLRVGKTPKSQGEDLDHAAERELAEETGLPKGSVYLEQLYTFGKSGRDPRARVISVAYCALVRPTLAPLIRAGGDAARAGWISLSELKPKNLAFDHGQIIELALSRIRGKIDYSNIAFQLVPDAFSISELRAAHEIIKGVNYDPGNFRRRFLRMQTDGIIEPAPGKRITSKRPAKVFRFVG